RTVAEIVVETGMRQRRETAVHGRGADAVQPAAAVLAARRGERGSGQLLRVQAMRRALRRILAFGQGPRQRLGGEMVAEAAHVGGGIGRVVLWHGVVFLGRDLAGCGFTPPRRGGASVRGYSTPRRIWSRSMLSNSAWKLPSP